MNIDRRTVLKAAFAAVATAAVGESLAGCDTGKHSHRTPPAGALADPSTSRPSTSGPSTSGPKINEPAMSASSSEPAVSPEPAPAQPAREIVHGPPTATGVALTFHGAGDPALATSLLGLIEASGGKATVLAVGSWLEQHPEMAKRILGGGHELGNHTYHHLTMPRLSAADDDTEIVRCAHVLRTLTGTQGRWFRPSGTTRATPAILAAASRAGYAECLSFDVDPQDYTDPGAAQVTTRLLGAVRAGSIVSLHLGHPGTVQAMPAILRALKQRNLPVVSMSSLMAT